MNETSEAERARVRRILTGGGEPSSLAEQAARAERQRAVVQRLVGEGKPLEVYDEADMVLTVAGLLLDRIDAVVRRLAGGTGDMDGISLEARVASLERLVASVSMAELPPGYEPAPIRPGAPQAEVLRNLRARVEALERRRVVATP